METQVGLGREHEPLLEGDRRRVAEACRVLAHAGVLRGILGHVSLRVGPDTLLVRSRGEDEPGLRWSRSGDVLQVRTDGSVLERGAHLRPPNELPLHLAIARARPEVQAVVHAHPPFALLAGLADLPLQPVFGAYNIPATRLASSGRIAVFSRAVLINDGPLASELVVALGDAPVCLLRGHGIVSVGTTLEKAVMGAIDLEELCRVTVDLHRLGVQPRPIDDDDLQQLPDLGRSFNDDLAYRALVSDEQVWRRRRRT